MQTQFKIDLKKLAEVKKHQLRCGNGQSLGGLICVMQAVDYVTTGGISRHPECACPVLTAYAARLNDRANDKQRQLLKPLITDLVGTRDGATKERAEFLILHSITKVMPLLVAAAGLKTDAERLKSFKLGDWIAMKEFCNELKPRLREADSVAFAVAHIASADTPAAYVFSASAAADVAFAAANADYSVANSDVEKKIWQTSFEGLKKACSIRKAL